MVAIVAAAGPNVATAKGCLKGAAVGGVAGHVAGHHGVVGAVAGCAIGHHREKVKDKAAAQPQIPSPDKEHAAPSTTPVRAGAAKS
jgi:hypothetical protein